MNLILFRYTLQKPDMSKKLLMFLKYADGLDRVRVGDLGPAMLQLAASGGLVTVAEELY